MATEIMESGLKDDTVTNGNESPSSNANATTPFIKENEKKSVLILRKINYPEIN